jgi:glycosyltransferase involved in cell wall biosynthesis
MEPAVPLVSVIVPTAERAALVPRAIASALRQSLRDIEVIAVVDGPDDATLAALRSITDPRLQVLSLPTKAGLGGARSAGIDAARGAWIALLDDDDQWLPAKLERQLEAARCSRYRWPIVSCRFRAVSETGEAVLPRRFPRDGEPISEYLFCQTRLLGGEGVVLPSTILTAAELLRDTRFRYARFPHEGSDWTLRAMRRDGVGIEFVAGEPLVIWNGESGRGRMSDAVDWRASVAWAAANRDLLTARAYAAFLLIRAGVEARRAREWRASPQLIREAFRRGEPTIVALIAHLLIWLVPDAARRAAASVAARFLADSSEARA